MSYLNLNYYVQYKKARRENRRKRNILNTIVFLFLKILLHIYIRYIYKAIYIYIYSHTYIYGIYYTHRHIHTHISGYYTPHKKGRYYKRLTQKAHQGRSSKLPTILLRRESPG